MKQIYFGLLASVVALGCGTSKSQQMSPTPVLTGTIAGAAMACAQMPLPTTGTIYYACDCGSGADASCQPGSDSNAGTSPDKPWQTYKKAQNQFASLAAGDTIAFCKGGSFTGNGSPWVNTSCRANNVCTVRDYTPSWAGSSTAMPKLVGASMSLANPAGAEHEEGYQFLNLEFDGSGSGDGLFIYNDIKDVLVCNVVLKNFYNGCNAGSANTPVSSGSDGLNARITVRGSQILNNSNMGWIGACSGCSLEYNYFDHNGAASVTQHSIYLSDQSDANGNAVVPSGEQVIGNEMHHNVQGSGTNCGGTIFVVHGKHDQMLIQGNLIAEEPGTTAVAGCWGISLVRGNYPTPEGFTNVTLTGNTVVNVGNASIQVESCQSCVVENNLVINTQGGGILIQPDGTRASKDLQMQNVQVLNNTVYEVGTAQGTGITVGGEGSGYVVAGNAVVGTMPSQWSCFGFGLATSAYYSDHNLCWVSSAKSTTWAKGMALAAWQTGTGLDTHSLYADPMFKNAADSSYDFTAMAGSPLIGAGDPTHGATVDITGKTRPSPPDIGAYQN